MFFRVYLNLLNPIAVKLLLRSFYCDYKEVQSYKVNLYRFEYANSTSTRNTTFIASKRKTTRKVSFQMFYVGFTILKEHGKNICENVIYPSKK
jgi:hypothetical protein